MKSNSNGCQLTLIGYLKEISNKDQNHRLLLERYTQDESHDQKQPILYPVFLNEKDFKKVEQFGFLGMLLSVSADLIEKNAQITVIAKKVDFLCLPKNPRRAEIDFLLDDAHFDFSLLQKLKSSMTYQSALYYESLRNVH